jgi:hypothetical protein
VILNKKKDRRNKGKIYTSSIHLHGFKIYTSSNMGKCFSTGINIYLFRMQRNVTAMIQKFQNGRRCHGNYERIRIILIRL